MSDKQQTKQSELHELEQFINLWSIVPGGSNGKGVVLLRKIVDSIHCGNYLNPVNRLPSFLIIGQFGTGKRLVSKALANSMAMEDIRECPAQYLDNGISSNTFFEDSTPFTAHIITGVHDAKRCESVLWRYLREGKCAYYNFMDGTCSKVIYCNGLIIMTATSKEAVSPLLLKATTHVIDLEPYTQEQLKSILHQYLFFMGIEYQGEAVLEELAKTKSTDIKKSIELLKIAVNLMRAELQDYLTVELVNKAKRLLGEPLHKFGENIPF